jgi:predicted AAA+ superfamily ATPase
MVHLHAWQRRAERRPLLIRGARQVGKTVLVRMFGAGFRRYAELDLGRPDHANLFRRGLSAGDLIQAILLECNVPPGDDPPLVFLDEVQECPEAVAALRYLQEDCPQVPVIAAGSLLEVALETAHIPFPVGRVEYLYLRPLTFAEFLGAVGEAQARTAYLSVPTPAFAEAKLLQLFHLYALIGGMPAAVAAYIAGASDLGRARDVCAQLMAGYRDDIPKYARNPTLRQVLMHCLDTAPEQVGTRITFEGFGGSRYRSREVGEALRTLQRAMLLELLYPSTQTEPPFLLEHRKSPRLQFLDVGLVNYRLGLQSQLLGIADLNDAYRGRILEQVVGQELLALDGRDPAAPGFWVRDKPQSQAEVDFLLRGPAGSVPVEAKSGAAGKLRSLHEFMARSRSPFAIRLYAGAAETQEVVHGSVRYRLLNLPYWAAGMLPEWVRQETARLTP